MTDFTLQSADFSVRVIHATLDPVVEIDIAHVAETSLAVHTILLGGTHHLAGDYDAYLADAADVWVEQAVPDLLGRQGLGEGFTRGVDHVVGNSHGFGENTAQSDTWEDVHVVALTGVVRAGLTLGVGVGHGGEGRARGEEAAAVSVLHSAFEVALGFGGGIGEGEDDGSGVPIGHFAKDLGSENAADG